MFNGDSVIIAAGIMRVMLMIYSGLLVQISTRKIHAFL